MIGDCGGFTLDREMDHETGFPELVVKEFVPGMVPLPYITRNVESQPLPYVTRNVSKK